MARSPTVPLLSGIKARITAACPCGRAARNKAGPNGAPTAKPEFIGGAALVRLQQAQAAARVEKIARDAMELARACMSVSPEDEALLEQPMLTERLAGAAWEAATAERRGDLEEAQEGVDGDDAASLGSCVPLLRAYWSRRNSFLGDGEETSPSPFGTRAATAATAETWWV